VSNSLRTLIAQTKPQYRLNQNEALYRREMITLHMQMVEAAEEALNPRTLKSRVWQTIKTSNAASIMNDGNA